MPWIDQLAAVASCRGAGAALSAALSPSEPAFSPSQSVAWITGTRCGLVEGCRAAVAARDEASLIFWQQGISSLFGEFTDPWLARRANAVLIAARASLLSEPGEHPGELSSQQTELLHQALGLYNGEPGSPSPPVPGDGRRDSLTAFLRTEKVAHSLWQVRPLLDLILYLLAGTWARAESTKRVSVPFDDGANGVLARLCLTMVAGENFGELYPDPKTMLFVRIDDEDFSRSVLKAWNWQIKRCSTQPDMDVLWSLERFPREEMAWVDHPLAGSSASAGFAVALMCVFGDRVSTDPNTAITGELLDEAGHLGGVSGYDRKAAAFERHPNLRLLVPEGDKRLCSPEWFNRIEEVRTVEEAWERGSGLLKETLAYLDTVAMNAESPPPYYPQSCRLELVRARVALRREGGREIIDQEGRRPRDRAGYEAIQAVGSRDRCASLTESGRERANRDYFFWDDLAPHIRRAVILADTGMGKTLLLSQDASRLARSAATELREGSRNLQDVTLVFTVSLHSVAETLSSLPPHERSLPAAVTASLRGFHFCADGEVGPAVISDDLLAHFRERLERRGSGCVILLDSLDGVPAEPKELCGRLFSTLRAYSDQGTDARILLTSRRAGYRRPWAVAENSETDRELELLPFDPTQVADFITGFFGTDRRAAETVRQAVRASPQLAAMSRIPLCLGLVCTLHVTKTGELDWANLRRTDVYRFVVESLLQRVWDQKRQGGCLDDATIQKKFLELEKVAWGLFAAGSEQFTRRSLYETIQTQLALDSGEVVERMREWCQDGILVRAGAGIEDSYRFMHPSFMEFFAASSLAAQAARAPSIDDWFKEILPHLPDPRWAEVLAFLGGLLSVDEAFAYLDALRSHAPEDLFLRPLQIACRVVAELPEEIPRQRRRYLSDLAECVTAQYLHGGKWLEEGWRKALSTLGIEAIDVLRRALCSQETLIRGRATSALLQFKSAGAAAALDALRKEHDQWVWRIVSTPLKLVEDPEAVPLLLLLLDEAPPTFREEIIESLAGIADPVAIPALVRLLSDASWDVPPASSAALVRIGKPAIPALLAYLEDNWDETGRTQAITALGSLKVQAAVPDICRYLDDKRWRLRSAAAAALGQMGTPSSTSALVGAMADKEGQVRSVVAKALGNTGNPSVVPALVKALNDRDFRVRSVIAEALGHFCGPEACASLLELLRDRNWAVQISAAKALAHLDRPRAIDALFTLLKNVQNARLECIRALAGFGEPVVIEALHTLLDDTNRAIHGATLESLEALGDPAILTIYLQDLASCDIWKRGNAARKLGLLGDPSALSALVRAMDDKEAAVRKAAVEAIGNLKEGKATIALQDQLARKGDVHVAAALGRAGDPAAVPALLRFLLATGGDTSDTERLNEADTAIAVLLELGSTLGIWTEGSWDGFRRVVSAGGGNWSHPDFTRALRWLGMIEPGGKVEKS